MTAYYVAVALLAVLNVAGIALSAALWVRVQRLERELPGRETPVVSSEPVSSPSDPVPPPGAAPAGGEPDKFSAALMGGEMTLRLAQEETREPPEKYRYITGLADQGMSADEIARVLHLAPGEVQQLLTLARLGRGEG